MQTWDNSEAGKNSPSTADDQDIPYLTAMPRDEKAVTVRELKNRLRSCGLPCSGTKAQLLKVESCIFAGMRDNR